MSRRLAVVTSLAVVLSACTAGAGNEPVGDGCEGSTTLTVLAASSLADAFESAEPSFVDSTECVDDVVFSFGSSATLAAQVVNGSPVDVFVAASRSTMQTVVDAGVTDQSPVVFARNEAALMVSTRSERTTFIDDVADLLDARASRLTVGLCAPSVPCGSLADAVLANAARVLAEPGLVRSSLADTEATSVEDLVTKIRLGEIDAGVTYVSDCPGAVRSGDARCVEIPADVNSSTDIAAVSVSARTQARDFVSFLVGDVMQRTLQGLHGFGAPK